MWRPVPDPIRHDSLVLHAFRGVYKEGPAGLQPFRANCLGKLVIFFRFTKGAADRMSILRVAGFEIHREFLDGAAQLDLLAVLREVVRHAPLLDPVTPRGARMSVRMTAAGIYGWISDRAGYRYEPKHPTGVPWPPIPEPVLAIWRQVSGVSRQPECCLVNFYGEGARMGLHQDKDEADFEWPVVSVSLGDDALFRMGGAARSDPTQSLWLRSGDVVVMGGQARRALHGVDRIRFRSSGLLPQGGRINLTLRVVK